jgi:DNA-binding CsgD family transcriptional regulator
LEEIEEAQRLLELGLREADEAEDLALRFHALHGLSEVAERTARVEAQQAYAKEMLGLSRRIDNPFLIGLALGRCAAAAAVHGKPAEAESLLREAVDVLSRSEDGASGPADPGGRLATLLLLQGRFGDAAEILRTTIVGALRASDMYMVTLLVGGMGIALGLSGTPGLGIRLMTAAKAETRRRGLIVAPGLHEQLERGLRQMERAAGDELAQEETAKGAQLSILEAVELALNSDVEPGRAEPPLKHPGNLTAREAEVLRLLAAGHTNRQIATQLVLSVRTVETHIFNVYSKTNTGGRAAATGWAIANGIYDPRT